MTGAQHTCGAQWVRPVRWPGGDLHNIRQVGLCYGIYKYIVKEYSATWMGIYCCDAPLIDVGSISLYFLIGAAPSVPIMTTGYVDSVLHHTCSSISNTFKMATKKI